MQLFSLVSFGRGKTTPYVSVSVLLLSWFVSVCVHVNLCIYCLPANWPVYVSVSLCTIIVMFSHWCGEMFTAYDLAREKRLNFGDDIASLLRVARKKVSESIYAFPHYAASFLTEMGRS